MGSVLKETSWVKINIIVNISLFFLSRRTAETNGFVYNPSFRHNTESLPQTVGMSCLICVQWTKDTRDFCKRHNFWGIITTDTFWIIIFFYSLYLGLHEMHMKPHEYTHMHTNVQSWWHVQYKIFITLYLIS